MWNTVLCLFLLALFCGGVKSECTKIVQNVFEEGLQNISGHFSWLGVFKVHLFSKRPEVKMTGVILITKSFAIINAEDVIKLPYKVFQQNTTVMFYMPRIIPWYVKPIDYFIHPEYKTKTFSTIALLKLDVDDFKPNMVLPVCWFQNNSPIKPNDLWVTGYINRNHDLQRFMISAHLLNKRVCQDGSKTFEPIDITHEPVHFICLNPNRSRSICKWQNGVALISNERKFYTLVGFGLQNIGCNSTLQFIDLDHYYLWAAQFFDMPRSIQHTLKSESMTVLPRPGQFIHNGTTRLLVPKGLLYSKSTTALSDQTSYENSTEKSSLVNTSWLYSFVHLDTPANNSILISQKSHTKFKDRCHNITVKYNTNWIHLQYGPDSMAAIYKFTLQDLMNEPCTYIKMRIVGLNTTGYKMNYCEVIDMGSQEKTPDEDSKFDVDQEELDHLNTKFGLESNAKRTKIKIYELYLALNYDSAADLVVELYGIKKKQALVLNPTMIKEIMHHDLSIVRFEWKSVHLLSKTVINEGNSHIIFSTDDIFNNTIKSSIPTAASQSLSGSSNTLTISLNILFVTLAFRCILQKLF